MAVAKFVCEGKWLTGVKEEENLQKYPDLYRTLPVGYEYHVCRYEDVDGGYLSRLRVAVTTEEAAKQWLNAYQELNKVTLRIRTTVPKSGKKNLFKVYLRCQHNTLPRRCPMTSGTVNGKKNTNCLAQLILTVRRPVARSRAKIPDLHMPKFAMLVDLDYIHNHSLSSAEALKYRDVSENTVAVLKQLFSQGHSPSSALDRLKVDLQQKHGPEYLSMATDRSIIPDPRFCCRLYQKIYKRKDGATTATNNRKRARADVAQAEAALSAGREFAASVSKEVVSDNDSVAESTSRTSIAEDIGRPPNVSFSACNVPAAEVMDFKSNNPTSAEAGTSDDQLWLKDVRTKLDEFCEQLKADLNQNPSELAEPLMNLTSQYLKLSSHSAKASALSGFGKCNRTAEALCCNACI